MKAKSALLAILFASTMSGQTITVGVDVANPNSSDFNLGTVLTDISLDNPATAAGTISTVKFHYSGSGCSMAVKIKFFRRSGNTLTMLAEQGPFDTGAGGSTTVTLSPPVIVQQGDLIGITKLTNCGNPVGLSTSMTNGFVGFAGDVTGSVDLAAGTRGMFPLALFGSGTSFEFIGGILPVVGSVTGSFGSNFKTSLQLFNGVAGSQTLTGRFIFHRAGTSGSASDPSQGFTVAPGHVVSYPDIVAALGQATLGSIDVIIPTGQPMPVMVTRIFNDAGVNGTAGFTEDVINPAGTGFGSRVITTGTTGALVTPIDPTRTRFNIGVRTLSGGAQMLVKLLDSNGNIVTTVSKTYAANWFEQVDSTTFFGGAVSANQSILFNMNGGSAIIYGSTTDNVTNDPTVQFAQVVISP